MNLDVVVQYLGFSGGNIFSLLDDPHNRLDATLRAFHADAIILQIGGNDIDHKEFDISLFRLVFDILFLGCRNCITLTRWSFVKFSPDLNSGR